MTSPPKKRLPNTYAVSRRAAMKAATDVSETDDNAKRPINRDRTEIGEKEKAPPIPKEVRPKTQRQVELKPANVLVWLTIISIVLGGGAWIGSTSTKVDSIQNTVKDLQGKIEKLLIDSGIQSSRINNLEKIGQQNQLEPNSKPQHIPK